MLKAQCVVILALVGTIRCKMEAFIEGGQEADIEQYPYCAYLRATCIDNTNTTHSWMCGSSIINQVILLTAAHCLDGCDQQFIISISAGSTWKNRGHTTFAETYIVHGLFDRNILVNDIGLVKMKNGFTFSTKLSRVALMRNPPKTKVAHLAGWGYINETTSEHTQHLMNLPQTIWQKTECEKIYGELGPGKFCASRSKDQFAAQGDSGSALVAEGYIQIGLVSHKKPKVANYLIIYTNVSYYYDWIERKAERLYCP